MVADQATGLREMAEKNKVTSRARVLTITSGKGGVGKSSLSVNLGLALVKAGKKVLLFDADLGMANVNVLLGIIPKFNLYHVIKGHKTLREIIISTPDGLDMIAGASGYSSLADLPEEARHSLIESFDEISPEYDFMIIDTGAGVGANVVGFASPADEVIVVTTPEPTAITDAYGVIKSIVMSSPGKPLRLIVNRTTSSLEGKKVAERVINITRQFLSAEVESIGFIYEDENVPRSVRKQQPYYSLYPKSKASSCLNAVSARLLNIPEDSFQTNESIGHFFRRLLGA